MKKQKYQMIVASLLLLLMVGCGVKKDGFSDGHMWIMPRPASEFHIQFVDEAGQTVDNAQAYFYAGKKKVVDDHRLLNASLDLYDAEKGIIADENGELIFYFLGESGGYEVPLDWEGESFVLKIEAEGYKNSEIDLDDYFYTSVHKNGSVEIDYDGETRTMDIFEITATVIAK